jgi:hypothetical protein
VGPPEFTACRFISIRRDVLGILRGPIPLRGGDLERLQPLAQSYLTPHDATRPEL